MNQVLRIQEISIAIAISKQNPTIVTEDFLKSSNIVPNDWQVARPPVLTQMGARINFQNGISLVAQPDRLIIAEKVNHKSPDNLSIENVARQYVKVLSQLNYQQIRTILRGHLPFGKENVNAGKNYIFQKLLSPEIQKEENQPLQAGIQLIYRLNEAQFSLEINEAGLIVEKSIEPVVVFSGSFVRNLKAKEGDKLSTIETIIGNLSQDRDTYLNLIETQFLTLIDRPIISIGA
jgi:hypothetical protein